MEHMRKSIVEIGVKNAAEGKIEIRTYDTLPEEAVRIRREVFMEEQGFAEEFDELDGRAKHLVLYAKGEPGLL